MSWGRTCKGLDVRKNFSRVAGSRRFGRRCTLGTGAPRRYRGHSIMASISIVVNGARVVEARKPSGEPSATISGEVASPR